MKQWTFARSNNDNPAITNVVLDLPQLSTVANNAFENQGFIRSVELMSVLPDMGQVTNVLLYAAGGALMKNLGEECGMIQGKDWVPNDLRIYLSKRQWTKDARDAATYSAETNPDGIFLGEETFTDKEKEMIAADPTLAGAYGVLVVKKDDGSLVRKAFFVHKPSPNDKVPGLMLIIR